MKDKTLKLMIVIGIGLGLVLSACQTTDPEPFILGDEVKPPRGCVEARKRGVDC